MVTEVFRAGIGNSGSSDFHGVIFSVSDAKVKTLIINIRVFAGSFVDVSNFLAGYILWMKF